MDRHLPKLILCDVDGTLLPSGANVVSARVHEAFHAAMGAGIRCGFVSGRNVAAASAVFEGDAACHETAIGTNGMEVYLDGRLAHLELLPSEMLERIADELRDEPRCVMGLGEGMRYHVVVGEPDIVFKEPPDNMEVVDAGGRLPDIPLYKLNVFLDADRDGTLALTRRLAAVVPELDVFMACPGCIDFTTRGCNKATAIKWLCDELGIGLDEVVVFGDENNDLAMLSFVPNSVAVENASPEAAAAARWHIGSVDDDAVPDAIDQLAAGRWPFVR